MVQTVQVNIALSNNNQCKLLSLVLINIQICHAEWTEHINEGNEYVVLKLHIIFSMYIYKPIYVIIQSYVELCNFTCIVEFYTKIKLHIIWLHVILLSISHTFKYSNISDILLMRSDQTDNNCIYLLCVCVYM